MIELARQLKALRKARGYTQEEVAEAANVSPQSVSKWERGECYPDITLLPVLANLFETSIDNLMGMDSLRAEAHRNAVFTAALNHFRAGQYEEAAAVLREHLDLFPNDLGALGELALHTGMMDAHRQQAIALAEAALERGAPLKVQHTVRAGLCLLYAQDGQLSKAQALCKQLPHSRESREEMQAVLGDSDHNALRAYLRYLVLGE